MDLPSKKNLIQFLEKEDFFLWEYYGEGIGKIQSWIFRSRIKAMMKFVRELQLKPTMILDVGCGPMFISYALVKKSINEYIGIDIMQIKRLRKYRDSMRKLGVEAIEVIRADAETLPFRKGIFDFVLSLDVFEHLDKPREAAMEIHRVIKERGIIAMSLPLENLFHKVCRIGLVFMKITGDRVLKEVKRIRFSRGVGHYLGSVKSYEDMMKEWKKVFNLLHTRYAPVGLYRSISVNAVHIWRKEGVSY